MKLTELQDCVISALRKQPGRCVLAGHGIVAVYDHHRPGAVLNKKIVFHFHGNVLRSLHKRGLLEASTFEHGNLTFMKYTLKD